MEQTILEWLKNFYPQNLAYVSEEYEKTKEYSRLLQYIEKAKIDKRWQTFKDILSKSKIANESFDHTFYSAVKVSFEVNDSFDGEAGTYSFFFYISMLLPFYTFKSKLIYKPSIDIENLSRLEQITLIKTFKKEELAHYSKHAYVYNIIPAGLEKYIKIFIDAQNTTFNYSMFPTDILKELIPQISVNNKPLGEATFFDCVFTSNEY